MEQFDPSTVTHEWPDYSLHLLSKPILRIGIDMVLKKQNKTGIIKRKLLLS